jgi:hypothetical protein
LGVQEISWEKGGTERAEDCTLLYGEGNGNYQLGTGFFVQKRNILAFRRVEFIGNRMSYILLRNHWCNVIILNVQAPYEIKSDEVKDSFYEEVGCVFDQFPRYNSKILLSGFNAELGTEVIFKPRI